MLLPSLAQAATVNVDDATGVDNGTCGAVATPCKTIQQGVTNATALDTVRVTAGTYATAQVDVDKALILQGAKAGVDARNRTGAETIVDATGAIAFDITAPATVDGFTFTDATQSALGYGSNAVGNAGVVQNNIFFGNRNAVLGVFGNGSVFRQNEVDAGSLPMLPQQGLELNSGAQDNVQITDNEFAGLPDSDIVFVGAGASHDNAVIARNLHSSGTGNFLVLQNNDDATVTDNVVTGATSSAIVVRGGSDGVTIRGNRISNGGGNAISISNPFALGPNSGISILGNTLQSNLRGVRVNEPASVSDTVEVHFNRIVGSTMAGVSNTPGSGGAINAENNWWGCNAGPNQPGCDTTGGMVDFDPWLVLQTTADPAQNACTGAALTADLRRNSAGGTPAGNLFPDGTSIAFATTSGSIETPKPTVAAAAQSTLIATAEATVSATLDGHTARTGVRFDTAVDAPVVTAKKSQKQKGSKIKVKVTVGAGEAAAANISGVIKVKKKRYSLKAVSTSVGAGQSQTVTLKPAKKSARKKIAKALAAKKTRKKVKALVTGKLTDSRCARANSFSNSVTVKLKLKPKKR